MRPACENPWTTLFVWGNGDVTHCCYSSFGPVGNVRRQALEEIWAGERLARVRAAIARGDLDGAGCEPWCRVHRWHRFYGERPEAPRIPEGLGREPSDLLDRPPAAPSTLGVAIDWRCNLRCLHCGGTRDSPGLPGDQRDALRPALAAARTLRLMNGEFSTNPDALAFLREVGRWPEQPRVFLNTNAQVPVSSYRAAVDGLRAFHLKLSLEGVGAGYERIRRGGRWDRFVASATEAAAIFEERRRAGDDWRLFLNFCLMRSNFEALPEVARFASDLGLPLVINTLHGARHVQENLFLYRHLRPGGELRRRVRDATLAVLDARAYPFRADVATHLDYVERCLDEPMIGSRTIARLAGRGWRPGRRAAVALYLLHRWRLSRTGALRYLARKLAARGARLARALTPSRAPAS
jgi:MoaA/NifB/PqqE/SkfB family radical SAM enzyme